MNVRTHAKKYVTACGGHSGSFEPEAWVCEGTFFRILTKNPKYTRYVHAKRFTRYAYVLCECVEVGRAHIQSMCMLMQVVGSTRVPIKKDYVHAKALLLACDRTCLLLHKKHV